MSSLVTDTKCFCCDRKKHISTIRKKIADNRGVCACCLMRSSSVHHSNKNQLRKINQCLHWDAVIMNSFEDGIKTTCKFCSLTTYTLYKESLRRGTATPVYIRKLCKLTPWLHHLAEDSVHYYLKLLGNSNYSNIDLGAYAVYTAAKGREVTKIMPNIFDLEYGITLNLMAAVTGCSLELLKEMDEIFQNDAIEFDPLFYIGRLCHILEVPLEEELRLRAISIHLKTNSWKHYKQPEEIAAALIFLFSIKRYPKHAGQTEKISKRTNLKKMSKVCNINCRTIDDAIEEIKTKTTMFTFNINMHHSI